MKEKRTKCWVASPHTGFNLFCREPLPTASGVWGRSCPVQHKLQALSLWKSMKGPLETVWCWLLRLGRKEEWKLQPSECNCLALSLPSTLRAYKHQWKGKGLISKDIKFSELCDLWENKAIWENYFLKLKSRLGEWGHQPKLSLPLKNVCTAAFPAGFGCWREKAVAYLTMWLLAQGLAPSWGGAGQREGGRDGWVGR